MQNLWQKAILQVFQPGVYTSGDPSWRPPTCPFDEWTEVFGSERLTGALLDRLTHHVHILEMNGESYRLKRSRETAASQAPDGGKEE